MTRSTSSAVGSGPSSTGALNTVPPPSTSASTMPTSTTNANTTSNTTSMTTTGFYPTLSTPSTTYAQQYQQPQHQGTRATTPASSTVPTSYYGNPPPQATAQTSAPRTSTAPYTGPASTMATTIATYPTTSMPTSSVSTTSVATSSTLNRGPTTSVQSYAPYTSTTPTATSQQGTLPAARAGPPYAPVTSSTTPALATSYAPTSAYSTSSVPPRTTMTSVYSATSGYAMPPPSSMATAPTTQATTTTMATAAPYYPRMTMTGALPPATSQQSPAPTSQPSQATFAPAPAQQPYGAPVPSTTTATTTTTATASMPSSSSASSTYQQSAPAVDPIDAKRARYRLPAPPAREGAVAVDTGADGSTALVHGREKRSTAGNRLSRVLAQARRSDRDDDGSFYLANYGMDIFDETDSEYTSSGEEAVDSFDSDFDSDADEGGEVREQAEAETMKQAATPANRTSKKELSAQKEGGKRKKQNTAAHQPVTKLKKPKLERELKKLSFSSGFLDKIVVLPDGAQSTQGRRSCRRALLEKRKERLAKEKKDAMRKQSTPKAERVNARKKEKITLAQRLIEAVETERLNAQSLLDYQVSTARRRRQRTQRREALGPRICYRSFTETASDGQKVARATISFTDNASLNAVFKPHTEVDTRPPIELVADPPALPITEEADCDNHVVDEGTGNARSQSRVLFPDYVAPPMNIFKALGFA